MRWLGDERVSASLVMVLRADGHDVHYVAEIASGLSYTDVVALASRDNGCYPPGTRILAIWCFAGEGRSPAWC